MTLVLEDALFFRLSQAAGAADSRRCRKAARESPALLCFATADVMS